MISGKCCICGTVKNCEPYLKKVFNNIEKIGNLFDEYKVIIVYDKSEDKSLDILQEYKLTNSNLILYIENKPLTQYRTHNIARARNNCLDIIRNNFSDYEYFIMIDCDDVCSSPIDLNVFIHYLTTNVDWDSLSFNKKPYYDTWALSKYPYVFSNMHFKDYEKYGRYIEKVIEKTPPGVLIQCMSAFNGFAIYRTKKFIQFYYDPRPRLDLIPRHLIEKNVELCGPMYLKGKASIVDCEHRSFHLMAFNNGAKIRIAPEVIFS